MINLKATDCTRHDHNMERWGCLRQQWGSLAIKNIDVPFSNSSKTKQKRQREKEKNRQNYLLAIKRTNILLAQVGLGVARQRENKNRSFSWLLEYILERAIHSLWFMVPLSFYCNRTTKKLNCLEKLSSSKSCLCWTLMGWSSVTIDVIWLDATLIVAGLILLACFTRQSTSQRNLLRITTRKTKWCFFAICTVIVAREMSLCMDAFQDKVKLTSTKITTWSKCCHTF